MDSGNAQVAVIIQPMWRRVNVKLPNVNAQDLQQAQLVKTARLNVKMVGDPIVHVQHVFAQHYGVETRASVRNTLPRLSCALPTT
jgi:hypothetical protein